MLRCLLLFAMHCYAITGFAQHDYDRAPLYHDSLRNDPYIREVNNKLDSIKALLRSREVRFDTVTLKVAYTVLKKDGNYILQNPYSHQRFSTKDKKRRITLCVASYQGAILGISLHRSHFFRDSTYAMTEPYLPLTTSPVLYFEQDTLVYSMHGCKDPNQFVGSCGGASSDYQNYFRNGEYYSTLINLEMYCGCGYNYIVTDKTLQKVREKLQKRLLKE